MAHRASTKDGYEHVWKRAQAYIDLNYMYDIIIDDFCKEIQLPRRTVQRALAHYNTGWRDMVRHRRLHEASRKLLHTNLTVKVIANSVGYKQQAQFAKAFNRQFGLTPSRYRAAFLSHSITGAAA